MTIAALATTSQASFELLLAVEYSTGEVHRYDGDKGAYLGSFGAGMYANASGVHADRSTGHCYVNRYSAISGVAVYNNNTGAFVNTYAVPSFNTPRSIDACRAAGYS